MIVGTEALSRESPVRARAEHDDAIKAVEVVGPVLPSAESDELQDHLQAKKLVAYSNGMQKYILVGCIAARAAYWPKAEKMSKDNK